MRYDTPMNADQLQQLWEQESAEFWERVYDELFCQFLDEGYDPNVAAQMATDRLAANDPDID